MAQDNAAQALRDLQKNLDLADRKLKDVIADFGSYDKMISTIFQNAAKNAKMSVDDLIAYIGKKTKQASAEKISLQVRLADMGKIEDEIKRLKFAIGTNQKGITIFGNEAIAGVNNMRSRLKELEEELTQFKNVSKKTSSQLYDDTIKIVNAAAADNNRLNKGTVYGQARANEMRKVEETTRKANQELEKQRSLEEAIAKINARGGRGAKFEGEYKSLADLNKMLESSRIKVEEYKRTLLSLGARGKQAAAGLGSDGYTTALKKQEQNFKNLNRLLNERRALQNQIDNQGTHASETQKRYQNALNSAIQQTVTEMRKLGKEYEGVTRAAAQSTMVERMRKSYLTTQNLNKSLDNTRFKLSQLLPLIRRIGYSFGLYFSARGLVQFGKKLVETRGEFEMQFVAMKQIIGDVDAATKIWNQTLQQSLQSPKTFKELVTYTKQLAAYRIETEKLFDTTKRLADVSAGLGVDMQRLILAYGQVKSANYLRASEVRQFTEAGVNIAGNLAKYFSELEGRMVGTAEVMERITKRMVLFSDVEAIFKRMTDEGGEFFNMQEIQADTVKGQIMKLHDAYDQMLNSIGEANQGTIRDFVDSLNNLVRNWQNVAFVLKANINWVTLLGGALLLLSRNYMKGATTQTLWFSKALMGNDKVLLKNVADVKIFSRVMGDFALKTRVGIVAVRTLQGALMTLGSVLKAIWPLLVFEGIVLLTERLTRARRELKRFREELQSISSENVERMNEEINGYGSLIEKLKKTNEGTMARKEILDEISQKYGKYLDFIVTEKTTIDELAGAYDNVVTSIRNYTAEKIREEQQQRLEKGMYDEYQDLIKNLTGARLDIGGQTRKISSQEAKNLAKIIQKQLEENGVLSSKDIQDILSTYFGETVYAAVGGSNTNLLKYVGEYQNAFLSLEGKLQEIRDDIEGSTPVFETEAQYKEYTANVIAANKAIEDRNKLLEEQVGYLKEVIRDPEEQWIIEDRIAEMRLENERKILEIKKQYGLITEEQYRNEVARLYGVLDDYESDYNRRLENAMIEKYGLFWETASKDARDMYNWVVTTESSVQQGTSQRNKQLIETYKGLKDSLTQYKAALEAALKSGAAQAAIALIQKNIDTTVLHMTAIEEAAGLRGLDLSGKKTTRTAHNYKSISTLISLLKEMNSEYEKLSKSAYGFVKSQEKVTESYKEAFAEIFGFAGLDISMVDFTDKFGVANAMQLVLDKLDAGHMWSKFGSDGGKKAREEFLKAFSQMKAEVDIEISARVRQDFAKEIEDMFRNYELSVEFRNLNIDSDAAKDWLDFDFVSIGQMLDALNEFADKQISENNFDEEDLKVYLQWAKKIEDQIYKYRRDKAKEYSKYLENELSERAKLEMEYAVKVAEVRASSMFSEEQREAILDNMGRQFNESLQELTWKSFKESDFYVEMMDDLTSIPAEYSALMLMKLNEILMHPEQLSPRALKEALNARQKIMEARRQLNPYMAMRENAASFRSFFRDEANRQEFGLQATTWKKAEEEINRLIVSRTKELSQLEDELKIYDDLIGQIEAYNKLKEKYDVLSVGLGGDPEEEIAVRQESLEILQKDEDAYKELVDLKQRGEAIDEEEFDRLQNESSSRQKNIEQLRNEIEAYRDLETARRAMGQSFANLSPEAQTLVGGGEISIGGVSGITSANIGENRRLAKGKKDSISNAIQRLKDAKKNASEFAKAWHEFNSQLNDTINKVKDMGNAFYDTYEALGGETDALTEAWKDFGNTMVDTITKALEMIPTLVTGFTAAGTAINASLGIIGLIAEAIQLVLVLIGALAKLNDAGYEKEIENQQKKIDSLQRAYERLEKSIEKAWDSASYMRTYNEEVQNLHDRIEATNKQIAAEEAKKNTDKDKIQDYKDSIQDMEDELDELKQKQIEVFGGIGEEGYRDAAQGFVDAWKSAFLETSDGLQGLQDHFDEFLQEWFVKQATMRVTQKALEPLFNQIDNAVEQYGLGGTDVLPRELERIREQFSIIAPNLSNALEELAGTFGLGESGGLSGLAAGIQGMTEEQANILEAYWNSVRGYTASIDQNVATIVGLLSDGSAAGGLGKGGVDTNPQLVQMKLIAANTAGINTLLQSVTKGGHALGGSGIKVFVN